MDDRPSSWRIVRRTAIEWFAEGPFDLAAALAYYTLFSLAPLVVIAISLSGLFFGEEAMRGEIFRQARSLVGDEAAVALQALIRNARFEASGPLATAASIATLLVGATAVFSELQTTLDRIWKAPPSDVSTVLQILRARIVSVAMMLVIGFLLMVSFVASAILVAFRSYIGDVVPALALLLETANLSISFGGTVALFTLMFRLLPSVPVGWREALMGGMATASLFTVGKLAVGAYIRWSGIGSTYGAAGSIIVLLAWVYYSSLIFFLGAEFTRVLASELRKA
jgi:membrane protein